jgi:hypothetical protein
MLRDFFKDIVTLKWRKIEEFLFFDGPQTYFIDQYPSVNFPLIM